MTLTIYLLAACPDLFAGNPDNFVSLSGPVSNDKSVHRDNCKPACPSQAAFVLHDSFRLSTGTK